MPWSTGDFARAVDLLPDLVANYEAWEQSRLEPDGLFWQIDDRDGMEVSIGGKRPPRPGQTRNDQFLHVRRCTGHRRHRRTGRQAGDRRDVHAKRPSESNGSSSKSSGTTTRSSSRFCPAARRPSWSMSANCTGSPLVLQSAGSGQGLRGRLETVDGSEGFLRSVRPDDRRAAASRVLGFVQGPRVPVERSELALCHVRDAHRPGECPQRLPAAGCLVRRTTSKP